MTETTLPVNITEITFPSNGLFYDGKLPGGKAQIRAWTTAEIKLLVSARKKGNQLEKALDRVIDNCLILPPGLRPDDLLYTDGFYALLAQRVFTYEAHFKSSFKCRECGFKNEIWVDLVQDLNPLEPKEEVKEPIEVMLPVLDIPLTLKLLRRKDAKSVSRYSKSKLEKAPMAAELGDPGYTYRIALQIDTIDGEKLQLGQKIPWIDALHARDLMAIENRLEDSTSGIDPTVRKPCQHPSCGEFNEFIIPMNIEFFRPRSTWPGDDPQDAS
jgi:hypothetical protein